jgi:hypothetical protein
MANIFRRVCETCGLPVIYKTADKPVHADFKAHDHAVGKVVTILVAAKV